jgi:hypothetical protein
MKAPAIRPPHFELPPVHPPTPRGQVRELPFLDVKVPSVRPGGGVSPDVVPPPLIAVGPVEGRLPSPERINSHQELLLVHAAERNWAGLHEALLKLGPAELPASAGRHLDGLKLHSETLRSLGDFRQSLNVKWAEDARPEAFEGWLRALEKQTPSDQVAKVRRYVALRARLEGRPDITRRLLGDEHLPDGPKVLRDLKTLSGADGLPPPQSASSLDGLPLPEPQPIGLLPALKESLGKGFEQEVTAAELAARKRVLATVDRSESTHANHVAITLYNLRGVAKALAPQNNEEEQRRREKEVETQLGRDLMPEERLLAQRLLRTMPPEKVAAELRALDKAGN